MATSPGDVFAFDGLGEKKKKEIHTLDYITKEQTSMKKGMNEALGYAESLSELLI